VTKVRRSVELVALVALTAVFLGIARGVIGIDRADETIYLLNSNVLQRHNFIAHQSWSPLYSFWYKLLGFVCPQFLPRYFLSWSLLVVLLALLPPVLRVPRAWLYTVFLLALPFLLIGPFVSLFAAAFLLGGMCLLLLRERSSVAEACLLACVLAFVTAFARPEFGFGVYLSAAAFPGALFYKGRSSDQPPRADLLTGVWRKCFALALVLLMVAGTHFVQGRSAADNRSGLAFQQHFNVRALESGALRPVPNPYLSHYAQQAFGIERDRPVPPETIPIEAYFRANPRLFLNHLTTNLLDPRTLFFLLALSGIVGWPWLRRQDDRLRPAAVYLGLCALPILASIIVIFPRDHYPVVLMPSIMIFTLQCLRPERWMRGRSPWMVAASVCLLWLGCLQVTRLRLLQGPFKYQQDLAERLVCVQRLTPKSAGADTTAFDPSLDLSVYLPGLHEVLLPDAVTGLPMFKNWVSTVRPRLIVSDADFSDRLHVDTQAIGTMLEHDFAYAAHPCPAVPYLNVYTRSQP
jgi:hypothetical protein